MRSTRTRLTFCLIAAMLGAGAADQALADGTILSSWQMKRLFKPTPADLKRETRGSVMIYDGLTDQAVTRALDEQFDRVDSMMFTRIVVTDAAGVPQRDATTGEIITEDDGCD